MDNALKQRILGVIVLFALIGICITVLLHNNKKAREEGLQATPTTQNTSHHRKRTQQIPQTQTNNANTIGAEPSNSVFGNPPPVTTATNTPTTTPTTTVTTQQFHRNTQILETVPTAIQLQPKTKTTPRASTLKTEHTTLFTKKQETAKPTTTHTTTTTTTKAFAVQVGTFSNRENALALTKALKGRGFTTATTSTVKTKHGTLTRVLIGEKGLTRGQAEKAKARIHETFQINGVITPVTKTTTHTSPLQHKTTRTTKAAKTTKTTNTLKTTKTTLKASTPTTTTSSTSTTTTTPTRQPVEADGFAPVTAAQPSHINTPATPRTTGNNTGAVTIP